MERESLITNECNQYANKCNLSIEGVAEGVAEGVVHRYQYFGALSQFLGELL